MLDGRLDLGCAQKLHWGSGPFRGPWSGGPEGDPVRGDRPRPVAALRRVRRSRRAPEPRVGALFRGRRGPGAPSWRSATAFAGGRGTRVVVDAGQPRRAPRHPRERCARGPLGCTGFVDKLLSRA
ncbi:hypothetical protein APASM_3305 [Actinosynnema pretiosum subsp. pretiosum]|nr:hypothetical protein APASM_3305 [Actinosynnema pretiosum subsp. pretiosum]